MKLRSLLFCAGLLIAAIPTRGAAVDYFLKLDGIPGESADEGHKDEIEILSFSFGATQTGGTTGGGGAGKVVFSDISFTKPVDKSSPLLYLQCAQGKHIPTAILYGRKAGERPTDYYIIKLTDVLISSVQTSGASGDERPTESLSLNFTKIEFSYARQKPDGSLEPPIQTGWDIKLNVEVR
jgi:type VI secretion system secreted protein Hcp